MAAVISFSKIFGVAIVVIVAVNYFVHKMMKTGSRKRIAQSDEKPT